MLSFIQIVEYIKSIMARGLAYHSNGSVYFDTASFAKSHDYPKLKPENKGNAELAEEGEGAIGSTTSDKKVRGACSCAVGCACIVEGCGPA